MKQLQRSEMEVLDAPIQMMNHNHHVIWAAVLKSFKYYHTLHTILDGPASSNKAFPIFSAEISHVSPQLSTDDYDSITPCTIDFY